MTLRQWLAQGPFTLSLSSGFFGFYSHLGFFKALSETEFQPTGFRGCSAGAIIAACWASDLGPQEVEKILLPLRRSDFWDPRPGFGLLKGERFYSLLEQALHPRFSDLARPAEFSVFNLGKMRTESLSEGSLPRAVWASAAVPGMFHPVRIDGRYLWDGGLFDPLAIHQFPIQERILIHDISNQTLLGATPKTSHLEKKHILRPSGVPNCGPSKMDQGPAILDLVYQKTKALLRA